MKPRKATGPTDITRRDFLYGVTGALLVTEFAVGQDRGPDSSSQEYFLEHGIYETDPKYYPPELTGMRGSHPGSFEAMHLVRDRHGFQEGARVEGTGETYDLIVVGGGISGLSAAWFYRQRRPDAKILIIDNHDDFGGHAKRNEFHSKGRFLIGYGGTQSIEGVRSYGREARELLKALGIEIKNFERYFDANFHLRNNLSHCVFFDKETFGEDRLVAAEGKPDWASYLAKTPLSKQAQVDLLKIQTEKTDYLPGLSVEQKRRLLEKISFKEFLEKHAAVDPQVVKFFQSTTKGGWAAGIDAVPALVVIGLGLKGKDEEFLGEPTDAMARGMRLFGEHEGFGEPYIYHFPDGNASIARLLVRSLIPGSAPGNSMEDIVTARFNYARLDQPESAIRLRLNSTAVRVSNTGMPRSARGVEVAYVRHGRAYKVSGKACVLACYNVVIPYICPELPEKQKQALSYGVKAPLTYTNVLISNWRAIKAAGLMTAYCPGSYFTEVYMDFPVSIGSYSYTNAPEQPAVLHLVHVPTAPGLPIRDQFRAGRAELFSTPFSVFETHIHDQLGRMLGPYGFDSHRDIEAITVNRWPHGYAYEYNSLWDPDFPPSQRPCDIGRKQFGRVFIANADAGAGAETQIAIAEAHRAITELLKA